MPHAVDNNDDDDVDDDDDNCVEMQVLFAYILNSCAVQPLNAFVCILALDSGLWGSTRTRMLRTRLVKPANASCMHERESLYVCVCVCAVGVACIMHVMRVLVARFMPILISLP